MSISVSMATDNRAVNVLFITKHHIMVAHIGHKTCIKRYAIR